MSKTIKRLQLSDWKHIEKRIDRRYTREVLGGKPSRNKIRRMNPNDTPINFMEWLALGLFLVLAFFAAFKIIPTAVHYAETFFGENVGLNYFVNATILVFALMNTVGFIYAKMQTEDSEILRKQRENPMRIRWLWGFIPTGNYWHVEVWSPRLYDFLTYFILVWQVLIAVKGISEPLSIIQWGNALLPVFAEIASATLLASVLKKTRARNQVINEAYKIQQEDYERSLIGRMRTEQWLIIAFQELREALTNMKANRWLETADADTTRSVIFNEYERLLAGHQFARDVLESDTAIAVQSTITGRAILSRPNYEEVERTVHTGQRVPPNGKAIWTVEDLIADFTSRTDINSRSSYTEKNLNAEYANGYKVRTAFRNGAKKFFRNAS